jgi:hypothetical protein
MRSVMIKIRTTCSALQGSGATVASRIGRPCTVVTAAPALLFWLLHGLALASTNSLVFAACMSLSAMRRDFAVLLQVECPVRHSRRSSRHGVPSDAVTCQAKKETKVRGEEGRGREEGWSKLSLKDILFCFLPS